MKISPPLQSQRQLHELIGDNCSKGGASEIIDFFTKCGDPDLQGKFRSELLCLTYLRAYFEFSDLKADRIKLIEQIIGSLEKAEIPARFWAILVTLVCTIKAGLGDVGEECMSDDQAFVLLHCIAKLESAANSDSLPQVTGYIRKDILECIQHGILTTSERIKRNWVEWSINRSSPGSGGQREFSLMMHNN